MTIPARICVAGGLLLAAAAAPAATPAPTPAPSVAPVATQAVVVADFSKGFALLHGLGVSNVSKAAYVTLSGREVMMYVSRSSRFGLTGNAWQLSGDATNGLFLVNETMLVRATTAKRVFTNQMDRVSRLRMMRYGGCYEDGEADEGVAVRTLYEAKWKSADLQADLDRLLARLQKDFDKSLAAKAKAKARAAKADGDAEEDPRMAQMRAQSSIYGGDISQWSSCLLNAVFYADQGHLPEANRVAALAMALTGSNQMLLEAVMDRLGNEAYQQVWAGFRTQGDWKAYAAGVDGVAARFPRGWKSLASARELALRLHAFAAAGARPAALRAKLAPADLALVDALATAPASPEADTAWRQPGFWALPHDTNDFLGAWVATNAHPVARLLRSGTNAIPLLVALLDDQATFTRLQSYGALASTNAAATPAADDAEEDDAARMMREIEMGSSYGSLARPATRGEVAAQLLQGLIGEDQSQYSRPWGRRRGPEPKSMADRVRAWQEERAGMTTEELAFACLLGKDYAQRSQAMQYLAGSTSTTAWQRLEKYLLNNLDQDENAWLSQTYVTRRGKSAKPFVDAFEARVASGVAPTNAVHAKTATGDEEELFKAGGRDDSSRKYRIQQQKRVLKEMRRIVDAKPFAVLVDDLCAGTNVAAAKAALASAPYTPPAEAVPLLVRGAARSPSVAARLALLQDVFGTYVMRGEGYAMPPPGDEVPGVAVLADAWRTLLADARAATNAPASLLAPPLVVRDLAALTMERLYATENDPEFARLGELGSDGNALLAQRAEARLANKPLPPLPDAERVPAARLAELTNAIPKEAAAAQAARLAALTRDERLALAHAAAGESALAQALAPTAHRLRAAVPADAVPAVRAALQACDGKVLNRAILQTLAQQCADLAKQGQFLTFELRRQAGFGGVEVSSRPSAPSEAVPSDGRDGVFVSLAGIRGPAESMICHFGGATAPAEKAQADEDPLQRPTDAELILAEVARIKRGPASAAETEAAFWKRVELFCSGDGSIGFPGGVRLVATSPAKAAK